MISRRRFIYCAATGLMVPAARAGLPTPIGFFKGLFGGCDTISAAATTALNDWVTRVQGQGSDVTIPQTQTATGCFIDGLMTDGVWSKIVRMSILAGDGLLALNAPLKNGGPSATDTLNNFVAGNYSQSSGLTGNGSTTFLDTGLLANSGLMGDNDIHLGFYSRNSANTGHAIGAYIGPVGDNILIVSAGNTFFTCNNDSTAQASYADGDGFGFYLGSRTSTSSSVIYRNAVSKATNTNAGGTRPAFSFYVLALNFNGSSFGSSAITAELYSVGTGLTATDVSNFNSRYATLRTALGR